MRPPVDRLGRVDDDLLDFTCPRCSTPARERFYGPCESCRQTLVAALGGPQRDVEAAPYQPGMNVTPNQVATKE